MRTFLLNGIFYCSDTVLHRKSKMHNIPVFHHIVLTLHRQFTGFPAGSFRTIMDKVFVLDHFHPDKSFFEISMNYTGSLWCQHSPGEWSMPSLPALQP